MAGRFFRARAAALLLLALTIGCESDTPPPEPSPGGDGGENITGRERIGWDQAAASREEVATLRFAIYVDGARSELAGVSCASSAGTAGFPCSAQLPSMTAGSHVLELAAFTASADGVVEGPRSAPLRVRVSGATSPAPSDALEHGAQLVTRDGVRLEASLVVEGLQDVSDLARTADGRLLIAERHGAIVLQPPGQEPFRATLSAKDGELLALALAPSFASSGHLFAIQSGSGTSRLVRYRLFEGQFIERMVLLPDVQASANPSATLRFGPDGKLYAAFDDAGDRDAAARLADWSGKILRLNEDGTTPEDQPAASPVFWSGIAEPLGLDWSTTRGTLWIAERGPDRVERLRALGTGPARPRRAGQQASYALPGSVGASSLAFYRSDAVKAFRDDLFVAARHGRYLLRVRFDETDRLRAITTEKLLEGRLGDLRAVLSAPDGALYVANGTSLWRLAPVDAPRPNPAAGAR